MVGGDGGVGGGDGAAIHVELGATLEVANGEGGDLTTGGGDHLEGSGLEGSGHGASVGEDGDDGGAEEGLAEGDHVVGGGSNAELLGADLGGSGGSDGGRSTSAEVGVGVEE